MKTKVWSADMPPFPREGIFHLEPAHDCPVTRMMVFEADRLRRINQLEAPENAAELKAFQKKLRRKLLEKTGAVYDGSLPVDIKEFGKLQLRLLKEMEAGTIHRQQAQEEVEKYWMGALRRAVVEGDVEYGSVMAGQSVGMADEVIPVKALIDELVSDASFELERIKGKLSVI